MEYLGSTTEPKDPVTKEYVDNLLAALGLTVVDGKLCAIYEEADS